MKIKEEPIIFENSQRKKLWGILSLPETKKRIPGAILLHGFKGTKSQRKFVRLARKLAENGIVALRFDFQGCGDSEGEFFQTTISQQLKDLEMIWCKFQGKSQIDPQRIGILGHSLGALIACLFQKKNRLAKTLVLVAPAIAQKQLIREWHTPYQLRKLRKQGYLDADDFRIGIDYFKEAKRYNNEIASEIEIPVLILHGRKDETIPAKYTRDLFLKLKARKKGIVLIKGADHNFEGYLAQEELISRSLDWFKDFL